MARKRTQKKEISKTRVLVNASALSILALIFVYFIFTTYGSAIICGDPQYLFLGYVLVPMSLLALSFATWLIAARFNSSFNRREMGYTILPPVVIYYIVLYLIVSVSIASCPLLLG